MERAIEREHVPAARELGLGIVPWSPLAGGFLTGKYTREEAGAGGKGRLSGSNPFGDTKFTDANFDTLEVLRAVADEVDRPLSQVALAWLSQRPGVGTVLLGVRTLAQLADNLAALEVDLTGEATAGLDRAGAVELGFPYSIYTDTVLRSAISGGAEVRGWSGGG